jgi:hypothetical protein
MNQLPVTMLFVFGSARAREVWVANAFRSFNAEFGNGNTTIHIGLLRIITSVVTDTWTMERLYGVRFDGVVHDESFNWRARPEGWDAFINSRLKGKTP